MSAALKLEVYQQGERLREVSLEGDELWIGRDSDCVIQLSDRAISRKHACIRLKGNSVEFEKVSKFGSVRLNGREIEQGSLKGGDRVEVGPYELRFAVEKSVERVVEASVPVPEVVSESVSVMPVESPVDDAAAVGFESQEFSSSEQNLEEAQAAEGEVAPGFGEIQMDGGQPEGVESVSYEFTQADIGGNTRVVEKAKNALKATKMSRVS